MGFRAAVTTSDGGLVDLHFGQSTRFLIIDVDDGAEDGDVAYREVEWRDVPEKNRDAQGCHGWFDKVVEVLPDVDYVLTAKIGPKPHRALGAAGIIPLESPENLQEALAGLVRYRQRQQARQAQ